MQKYYPDFNRDWVLGGGIISTSFFTEVIFIARTKFNVDKNTDQRTFDDIVFDSVLELRYYRDVLLPLVENGEVVNYELQKPYELQPKFVHDGRTVQSIKYVADFYIKYKDGREEVIDIKGFADATALLKRKLFWYVFPDIDYKWVSWSLKDGGFLLYEDLKKARAERRKIKKLAKEEKENENGKD